MNDIAKKFVWIDSDEQLAQYCAEWMKQPIVGLDTEFQRTDTFYPIAGLIQVGIKTDCYLIDPLAITDFSPFAALLQCPSVLKVLHACTEDLELFAHCYGVVPQPLFDTQVACAFIDLGLSIGYQRLLKQEFDVDIEKEETRSDWLQRPLTEAQKEYAALDVVYLEQLYHWIAKQLNDKGHYDWVMAECAALAAVPQQQEDYQLSYLQRFKQSWKLRPQQLAVLQALTAWREEVSRERDMPRNFVLHNNSIMSMAQRPPKTMHELSSIDRIKGKTLKTDGRALLDIVAEASELPLASCPVAPPRPLPADTAKLVKKLKVIINQKAESLGIAPELLVRKRDLEQLVRNARNDQWELTGELAGWREAVVGQTLLAALKDMLAS